MSEKLRRMLNTPWEELTDEEREEWNAIGVTATPVFIRLTRGQTIAAKVEDYVEAARAVYAENGWWRPRREDDDGKGRYRDCGVMVFRAVEWDDLDNEERAGLIRDAEIAINAVRSPSRKAARMQELALGLVQALNTHSVGASLHGQAYTDVIGAKNLLASALSEEK